MAHRKVQAQKEKKKEKPCKPANTKSTKEKGSVFLAALVESMVSIFVAVEVRPELS